MPTPKKPKRQKLDNPTDESEDEAKKSPKGVVAKPSTLQPKEKDTLSDEEEQEETTLIPDPTVKPITADGFAVQHLVGGGVVLGKLVADVLDPTKESWDEDRRITLSSQQKGKLRIALARLPTPVGEEAPHSDLGDGVYFVVQRYGKYLNATVRKFVRPYQKDRREELIGLKPGVTFSVPQLEALVQELCK